MILFYLLVTSLFSFSYTSLSAADTEGSYRELSEQTTPEISELVPSGHISLEISDISAIITPTPTREYIMLQKLLSRSNLMVYGAGTGACVLALLLSITGIILIQYAPKTGRQLGYGLIGGAIAIGATALLYTIFIPYLTYTTASRTLYAVRTADARLDSEYEYDSCFDNIVGIVPPPDDFSFDD